MHLGNKTLSLKELSNARVEDTAPEASSAAFRMASSMHSGSDITLAPFTVVVMAACIYLIITIS